MLKKVLNPNQRQNFRGFNIALLSVIGIAFSTNSYSQNTATAQQQVPSERWFEIEVILVEQLLPKDRSNEDFSVARSIKKPVKTIDLINDYLHNLLDYKHQLPACNKSLQSTASSVDSSANHLDTRKFALLSGNLTEQNSGSAPISTAEHLDNASKTIADNVEQPITPAYLADEPLINTNLIDQPDEIGEQTTTSAMDLDLHVNLDCSDSDKDNFNSQVNQQFYQVPRYISDTEYPYSNKPYLINNKSLQLKHITRSLRRSKEFRPLLHIGWRQAVLARNAAQPVKLMAGENLLLKANARSGSSNTVNIDLGQAQNNFNSLINAENTPSSQQDKLLLKTHINNIIAQLELDEINSEQLLAQINAGKVKPLINQHSKENNQLEIETTPAQDWFIDGFFKVHLNHYLFINSEFSVYSAQHAKNADDQPILIPFKQNRRVISGELHYFDHPYMGMIVQIRRHQRPEPVIEELQQLNTELD